MQGRTPPRPAQSRASPAKKAPARKLPLPEVSDSDSESEDDEELAFVCEDLQINYKQLVGWIDNNKTKELSSFWLSTYNQICAFEGHNPRVFNLADKRFIGQFLKHLRKTWSIPDFIIKDPKTLTHYLLTELQSVRMIGPKEFKEEQTEEEVKASGNEKAVSEKLTRICNNLHIAANDAVQVVQQLQNLVKTQTPPGYITRPLLDPRTFDEVQANVITEVNQDFNQQYTARKHMLRVRLLATVESMKQSTKVHKKELKEINEKLDKLMAGLEDSVDLEVWSIFCAQKELFRIDKVNVTTVDNNTRKFRIPHRVPDRGGRPGAIRNKDMAPSNWGGQGGGQRGGKRGYNNRNNRQGGYNNRRGGYNNRRY